MDQNNVTPERIEKMKRDLIELYEDQYNQEVTNLVEKKKGKGTQPAWPALLDKQEEIVKKFLFVIECICIIGAMFGICIFDSNCVACAVMLSVFGGVLVICVKAEDMYYWEEG